MKYVSVEEGRKLGGLRLVLTAGVPGPWGEAAKAVLQYKRIPYTAVLQEAGAENRALLEWTGHANAPTAVFDNEPPCSDAFEIVFLAERLAPEPSLVPADVAGRAAMFGLLREIAGRHGLGWERRIMMIAPLMRVDAPSDFIRRIAQRYGYSEAAANAAPRAVARILEYLATTLEQQQRRGNRWLCGEQPSAVDLYWASFSQMFRPLPPEHCPMPDFIRASYSATDPELDRALSPGLIAHRDRVFAELIGLPLDFAVE